MSSSRSKREPLPERWADALVAAGFVTGTGRDNIAAFTRALRAEAADESRPSWPSESLVRKTLRSGHVERVEPKLVDVLARVLLMDRSKVQEWLDPQHRPSSVWRPPASSALLTAPQWAVLNRLVEVMTADFQREDGERRGNTAPMNGEVSASVDGDADVYEAGDGGVAPVTPIRGVRQVRSTRSGQKDPSTITDSDGRNGD